ncbi:MAG: hypothetical protein IT463_04945 [Planctomycetes bacterium]|nr:hypothetical protein [Planctomycetota bacterium]
MFYFACPAAAPPAPRRPPGPASAELTPVTLQHIVQSPYLGRLTAADGTSFKLGSRSFTGKLKKGALHLSPGGEVPPGGATLAFGDRHLAVYPDALGRMQCFPADALKAEFDGLTLLFVDADFNGKHFDEGADYVIFGENGRYAFPYYAVMPLPGGLYTFAPDKGRSLKFTRQEVDVPGQARRLQEGLNRIRMDFGLFPTACDPVYSRNCQKHAEYLRQNGKLTHDEVAGNPGYSKEGHDAGMSSLVTVMQEPAGIAFSLFDTPLHGFDLRAPWFTQSAFGAGEGYGVIRVVGVKPRAMTFVAPAVFPPNNAVNVPTGWARETPDPRLDPAKGSGYPITLYFRWCELGNPATMTARLEALEGERWTELPCQVTFNAATLSQAARSVYSKACPVFVLPHASLAADTLHRLTVVYSGGKGEPLVSCFTTGSNRGQHAWDTTQAGK